MAQGKKSFIIYTDSRGMVNKLSNERAGVLFKTLFSYCDDENPICEDEVVDMAFEHFKNILKRDLKKYEKIVERNRENGKSGGRPRNPVGNLETETKQIKPKKADNDTDNDTVIILDNKENLEPINQSQKIIQRNESYKNQCETDTIWIENIYMKKIVAHGKITFALKDFNTHLVATGELKHDLKDYKTHFTNWAKLQK